MLQTTRSRNLDLIRWLHDGHENTSKKLSRIAHQGEVSRMATGQKEISELTARLIEGEVDLPVGWMDRDNISILKMSPIEAQIHQLVAALPEEKQSALFKLLCP